MSDQRQLPTGSPWRAAPMAWDASSSTLKPNSCARFQIASCSVGWPAKCTGTTTFGSRPRSLAEASFSVSRGTLRFHVAGSISTKSTSAAQYRPQLAEATKVLGTVQSRSPLPSPSAAQAICSAEVALLTATPCSARTCAATACSKRGTAGPCVRKSERSTLTTASTSAWVTS
jgi:hypothetical protein